MQKMKRVIELAWTACMIALLGITIVMVVTDNADWMKYGLVTVVLLLFDIHTLLEGGRRFYGSREGVE